MSAASSVCGDTVTASESRRRKQHRAVPRDDDGVLIVCREAAVLSANRPTISILQGLPGPTTDDGLDGQDEAFRQDIFLLRIPVVRDRRWLVNRPTDSVSFQGANDGESMPMDFSFDHAANLADPIACFRHVECLLEDRVNTSH